MKKALKLITLITYTVLFLIPFAVCTVVADKLDDGHTALERWAHRT